MVASEYNQCVEAYADKVYRFVLKMGAPESLANTLVKKCFTALWQRRKKIDPKKVKTFLFTEAFNLAVQRNHLLDQDAEPAQKTATKAQKILELSLQKLQPQQRALLILRDYEGYNYDEIGSITGLSEEAVKNEIYRARKLLKSHLVNAQFSG